MELASNGDLAGYATKHNGFKEPLACKWFFQASSGLAYLHNSMKTSHRDIKLDNILLDANMVAVRERERVHLHKGLKPFSFSRS